MKSRKIVEEMQEQESIQEKLKLSENEIKWRTEIEESAQISEDVEPIIPVSMRLGGEREYLEQLQALPKQTERNIEE